GDTHIQGDLYNWFEKNLKDESIENGALLILINGNLIVEGTVSGFDGFPLLFVTGNVQCDVLKNYDEDMYILGDAHIKYAFDGNYSEGSIKIEGTTYVPYLLNSDHYCKINPEGAVLINYYGDDNDSFDYDYTLEDFDRIMVPGLLDEDADLDQDKFIEMLKEGKSPLKKGVKTVKQIFEEELAEITNSKNIDKVTVLDLSEKNLKEVPKSIFKLKNLKILLLDNNEITEIPKEINSLKNLEDLYLNSCNIQKIPDEIFELKKLKILDLSWNYDLILPDKLGNLTNLKTLKLNYNQNFEFPSSTAELQNLEELEIYQYSDEKPIDFPEVITKLISLKKLNLGSNSFKTIPESFLNLQNLEELNIGSCLCYLNELPDLSKLKKLKILKADGSTSYITCPQPKQSLLNYFFNIIGLEELYIDRHGKSEETLKDEELQKLIKNLKHDPKRKAEVKACFKKNDTVWKGVSRKSLKAEQLKGIGKLQNLKVLDLSFNGLKSLPEEIFTLKKLNKIDLEYNEKLPMEDLKRLYEAFPKAKINAKKIRTRIDINDKNFKKVKSLNKKGITEMQQRNYAKGVKHFEEALSFCTTDKKYSDYDEMYAHYGIVYCLGYLLIQQEKGKNYDEMAEKLITIGKKTLKEFIPADGLIWHYTEEGAFQEECIRYIGNSVAWYLFENCSETETLNEALKYINRSTQYITGSQHHYIYDTQVRILLKLNRNEAAYPIVSRILINNPDFDDFQDFKKDTNYLQWIKTQK
ncbi:MAG: hypothetical protein K8R68_02305, partial [Bacteroidales bacterium]|nr:hypothetical protein [Bacteroidales bacterium]